MTVKRIQTCDVCGATRELADEASTRLAGWRKVTDGDLCTNCMHELEMWIDQRRADKMGR